jgi:FMN phosphatase YigB (HAD superfamily)
MKRAVLLDVDGVILRSPRPLARVANNCSKYVAQKLGVTAPNAERVNKVLYKSFGHTLLGLRQMYGIRATTLDFANEVYDAETMAELKLAVRSDPDFECHAAAARALFIRCQNADVPVYLFSNAPSLWCATVAHMKDLDIFGFREENIIGCGMALKPEHEAYARAEKIVGDADEIIFVDDSLSNITPVLGRKRWKPVHFAPDLKKHPDLESPKISTLRNLGDLPI